jgi:hypothetical protein
VLWPKNILKVIFFSFAVVIMEFSFQHIGLQLIPVAIPIFILDSIKAKLDGGL